MNKDINIELRKKLMENKRNTFNYIETIKELKKKKIKTKNDIK